MQISVGVVVFPGSNCEYDVCEALELVGAIPRLVWHNESNLGDVRGLVIPGGFAHGDYLRPGAIAKFSRVMEAVIKFAKDGRPVLGICNGFQILTEAGLLPGALQKNAGLRFICRPELVSISTRDCIITSELAVGSMLSLPINHFEGNYTCDKATLDELLQDDRVVMRYEHNPNGSIDSIAAIANQSKNVVGMMPHPERACDDLLGSTHGLPIFRSLLEAAK